MGYSGLNYKVWNGAQKLSSWMCSLQEQEASSLSHGVFLFVSRTSEQSSWHSSPFKVAGPTVCHLAVFPSEAHQCSSFLVQLMEMWLTKGWERSTGPSMGLWRGKELCDSCFLLVSWQLQTIEVCYLGMAGMESSWIHFSQTSPGFWKGLIYVSVFPKLVSGEPSLWSASGMSPAVCNGIGARCFPAAHQQLKWEFPSAPCSLAPDCSYEGNELRNGEGALTFCFPGSKDFSKILFFSGSLEILEGMRGGRILGGSLNANKAGAPHCLEKSREGPSGKEQKWVMSIQLFSSHKMKPKAEKLNKVAHLPCFGRGRSTGVCCYEEVLARKEFSNNFTPLPANPWF